MLAIPGSAAFPFGMANAGFESGNLEGWIVSPGNSGSAKVKTHYEHNEAVSYDPVCGNVIHLSQH